MNYNQKVIEKEEEVIETKGNIIELFKQLFSVRNIFCFFIAYLMSKLEFTNGITPFAPALLAAMYLFKIPTLLPVSGSVIGMIASNMQMSTILEYLAFALVFLLISAFIKIDGTSKKISTAMRLSFSFLIINAVSMLISKTLMMDLIMTGYELFTIILFYILFASAFFVFVNINKPAIFANEDLISFAVMLAIASFSLESVIVLNLSLINLIGIILVLVVGYKNGAISGCVTGALIGIIFGIISEKSELYITTFAFSGLIAGMLNRFGKLGVIIGFISGNMVLSYLITGQTQLMQGLNEAIAASLILMVIPKKLELKVDSIFNKKPMLESAYMNYLSDSQDAKSKLEAISTIFENISDNINTVNVDDKTKEDAKVVVMGYLKSYKEKNCLGCKSYKTCLTDESIRLASDYIIDTLENKKSLKDNVVSIECNKSKTIQHEIKEIYNNIRIAYLLKQKEIEGSKKIAKQYKEVSKIINTMSESLIKNKRKSSDIKLEETIKQELKLFGYNIYDGEYVIENGIIEYTFITDLLTNLDKQKEEIKNIVSSIIDKDMQINLILNSSKTEKAKIKLVSEKNLTIKYSTCNISKEEISGDNSLISKIDEDRYLLAIADGEGSGEEAGEASKRALTLIEKFFKTGFSKANTLETINSVLKIRTENSRFTSVDLCIINTKKSEAEFIKYGAAPTFVITNKRVSIINANSLPIGVTEHVSYIPNSKKLNPGDAIVMLSDGVITEENRDENVKKFAAKLKTYNDLNDLDKIARELSDFAKEEIHANDDITILISKIV